MIGAASRRRRDACKAKIYSKGLQLRKWNSSFGTITQGPQTMSLLYQSERWAPDFTGYSKRSSSRREQVLPVSCNKTESTKLKSAPTLSSINFVAPLRSENAHSAEDQAELAASTHQAAADENRTDKPPSPPFNLLSYKNGD